MYNRTFCLLFLYLFRNEFKKEFPNAPFDWDYAISEFNKSKYAKQDFYSWPVYCRDGYERFIKFVKEELLEG